MEDKKKVAKPEHSSSEEKKELKCGIIMPISEIAGCNQQHWKEVKGILEEAIKEAGFIPNLVSDANDSGVIQGRIVQNIYDNEMVVCDVSCRNPNVMFELGMRLAFDKPTIIVVDNQTPYSFDTAPIEHVSYPRDLNYHSINEFKGKIAQKIKATYDSYTSDQADSFLKHFGEFKVAKIEHTEGTAEDVILKKLELLEQQIRNINISSTQKPVIYPNDKVKQIVREAINEYCSARNIKMEDFTFEDESSQRVQELISYLEDLLYIRRTCGSPKVLRQTVRDILDLL